MNRSSYDKAFSCGSVARGFFTLVELLAAMGVLVILMGVMFQLLSGAQRAWELVARNTEVYENARIVFDVISRDLESAVAWKDDIQGKDLVFRQANPALVSPYASPDLCFVSENDVTESAAGILEIAYRHDPVNHLFERAMLDASDSDWNPYRSGSERAAVATFFNWVAPEKKGPVIEGVLAMSFVCLDTSFVPQPWDGLLETSIPTVVQVKLKLIDAASYKRWKRFEEAGNLAARNELENRQARRFSKNIFPD